MDVVLFEDIVKFIDTFYGLPRDCLAAIQVAYPKVPLNTLASILSTKYTKKMCINHSKLKKDRKEVTTRYKEKIAAGEEPGIIIRLANMYDVTPALVAKVILEEIMEEKNNQTTENTVTKQMIKEMYKDTAKIPDPDLAYEVFLSIVFDNMYGPIADGSKHALGIEYEMKLCCDVRQAGLTFKTEDQLNARGYDKTPDIKLDIPCAVDGFIINWIESKALFADKYTHDQYTNAQYHCYWNRFGPGLVVYWFGYVKTVCQPSEKRFIVRDQFPDNITLINPSLIELPKLKLG